jgi:GNAT superfamily N-acetyltransferase
MIIREAKVVDAVAICCISSKDLGYECEESFVKERLEHLDAKREVVYVAELNGTVVGYVHAEVYSLLYWNPMVNILGLAVASDCRRQGAGKALMKQVEEWAKIRGIKEIRLNSGGTRKEAHEFYRSISFDDEKVQVRFVKSID